MYDEKKKKQRGWTWWVEKKNNQQKFPLILPTADLGKANKTVLRYILTTVWPLCWWCQIINLCFSQTTKLVDLFARNFGSPYPHRPLCHHSTARSAMWDCLAVVSSRTFQLFVFGRLFRSSVASMLSEDRRLEWRSKEKWRDAGVSINRSHRSDMFYFNTLSIYDCIRNMVVILVGTTFQKYTSAHFSAEKVAVFCLCFDVKPLFQSMRGL